MPVIRTLICTLGPLTVTVKSPLLLYIHIFSDLHQHLDSRAWFEYVYCQGNYFIFIRLFKFPLFKVQDGVKLTKIGFCLNLNLKNILCSLNLICFLPHPNRIRAYSVQINICKFQILCWSLTQIPNYRLRECVYFWGSIKPYWFQWHEKTSWYYT